MPRSDGMPLRSFDYAALRRDTIERQAKALTWAEIDGLVRVRDRGSLAWCEGHRRAGGAISRMFERMVTKGLVTDAPHEITEHGRHVLAHRLG